MNIPNGVKQETFENLEFESGLILREKYERTDTKASLKDKVICATTGGIKVNISPVKKTIAFDGVLENTVGIERITGWTASVQFSTKEVSVPNIMMALGHYTANIESDEKVFPAHGIISEMYYKTIYILGKMGNGRYRQITLKNTINVNGLQEVRTDKGETEIAFDLQARYTIDSQDEAPFEIEYIYAAASTQVDE